jgi:hypothetical protein
MRGLGLGPRLGPRWPCAPDPCTYCTCTPAPPVLSTSSQKACALYVARTQYAARAHQLVARSNSKAQGVGSGCTACSHCRCCCCSCSCSCSRCSHCRNAVAVTQGAFRFHAPNPQPHPRPSTFLLALLLALALALALGFVAFPWGLGNGSPYILICTHVVFCARCPQYVHFPRALPAACRPRPRSPLLIPEPQVQPPSPSMRQTHRVVRAGGACF